MRITFVAIGSEQLAVSLLANIAKAKGHDVNLAFSASLFHDRFNLEIPWLNKIFDDQDEAIAAIREQEPDILVCSVLTATYQWMLEVSREAKRMFPNVKVIFGGVHVSAVPERVIVRDEVDYVIVGEGDEAFPMILDAIDKGDLKSPIYNTRYYSPEGELIQGEQRGFYQSLDALPPFSKEIWEDHISIPDHYMTMASRGCPYRCTFCFNNFFAELPDNRATRGKYVRHRSVDHMIEELKWAKNRYKKLKWIDFEDDVFTTSKKWLDEFLPRYKEEIDIPFQCLTHPRYMDAEIAKMLKDAGCGWVQMGIQTMDDDLKTGSLRRNEKAAHIKTALTTMIEAGLKVKVDHMFGLPNEPIEAQETARLLYAEHCPVRIQSYWTCFLPGTELLQQGLDEGIVTQEKADRLNEGEDFYFFRNADNIKDPMQVKIYQGYEFLFKIYPLLPRSIRIRLKEKHVRWMPAFLKGMVGTFADLFNAVLHLNPNFYVYGKFYVFHLYKYVRKKIGIPTDRKASHPVKGSPSFDLSAYSERYARADKKDVVEVNQTS